MTGAVITAALSLALYDYWTSPLIERYFPSQTGQLPLASAAAVVFSGVIWPFAILAAIYSLLETGRLAATRELELAAAREAATKADAAASAAQLAALRYQLNPHFLFNTLNAISSLIVTREYDTADAMLAKLSEFLRATLGADPEGLIPLEDELATLQHYLEIESIRFGERLEVDFAAAPGLHDAMVPSFVLQPLVENAIKYAVAPSKRPVMVRVEATRDGDDLVVMVEDDGEGIGEAAGGTGVGLGNVRRRLQVLFGERGSLEAVRRERGFIAIVRLPHVPRLRPSTSVRVA
jgi:LytS/YehU family sensor histidine kinase